VGIAASLVGGYLFMTGRSTKENAVPPDRAPGVSNTKDRA